MSATRLRLWSAALVASLALVGCAPDRPPARASLAPRPSPASASPAPVPSPEERALGNLLAELSTMIAGRYQDRGLERYVARVGARVRRASDRPDAALGFVLTDEPGVAAHALVGGQILISRGTLPWLGSEAELAAVLAHEVAHAVKLHPRWGSDERTPDPLDPGAPSRAFALDADEERQADTLGVEYLRRAGYDPRAMGRALAALDRGITPERGATKAEESDAESDPHPPLSARLARVAVAAGSRSGELGEERYASQIDGLALGSSGTEPRVVNDRYLAPGAVSFRLPAGHAGELTGALLSTTGLGPRLGIARFVGAHWRESLYTALQRQPHEWRSLLGGRVLVGRLSSDGAPSRAALLERAGSLFLVVVDGDDARAERALDAVLSSSRAEPDVPAPARRLRMRRARAGDSVRTACGARAASELAELAALNGVDPDERRASAGFVKCLEAGAER